jgi:hypothetical protein
MSDITVVTNPNKLTTVPRCATDVNFAAGGNPWNSQPNKVTPPSGMLSQGRVPLIPVAAEVENYYTSHFADALIELQLTQTPVAAGFTNLSDVRLTWLPTRKVLLQHQVFAGPAEKRVQFSPNLSKSVVTAMTNVFGSTGFEWRHVATLLLFVAGNSDVTYYMKNTAQGGDSLVTVFSSGSMSDSTVALPGSSSTQYRDLARAHDGSAVLALGCVGTVFKLARYPVVGSPTDVAVGSPWSSDPYSVLASKPGETRAWQCDKGIGAAHNTFGTTDGGVTISSVLQTSWNSSTLDIASSIMRPCWDSTNNRWIVATADLTSYATMAGNARLVDVNGRRCMDATAHYPYGAFHFHYRASRFALGHWSATR